MGSLAPETFLSHHRLALVGLSRDPRSLSRALFAELRARGYDVVPVNPSVHSIDGVECAASVRDVHPPADAAIVMTPAAQSADVVRDCAFAGIRHVWFHRGVGPGSVSDDALSACADAAVDFVEGCPFMFMPRAGWIHRAHGWWRRRTAGH
jgi:predicted CoA-binding protein